MGLTIKQSTPIGKTIEGLLVQNKNKKIKEFPILLAPHINIDLFMDSFIAQCLSVKHKKKFAEKQLDGNLENERHDSIMRMQ